jgi:hypothetical protein
MRKFYIFLITVFITISSFGQVTINEIYFLTGQSYVEFTGPAQTPQYNLATDSWNIKIYKANGGIRNTINLSGLMPSSEQFSGDGLSLLAVDIGSWTSSPAGVYFVLFKGNTAVQAFGLNGSTPWTIGGLPTVELPVVTGTNSAAFNGTTWVTDSQTKGNPNTGQTTTLPVVKNEIENFTMYPNPVANGKLYMSSGINLNKEVAIYALTGQQVYRKNLQNKEPMDIANLNKGIYLVKIKEEGKIATRKLVVN